MTSSPNQRLLLVHAHPDDETIGSGATMAKYVATGAQVTLVTCTLGEEGEILVPEFAIGGAAVHRIGPDRQDLALIGDADRTRAVEGGGNDPCGPCSVALCRV